MEQTILKSIYVESNNVDKYPFNLPIFKQDLNINFSKPVTFIVGENGSGKSTLLENLANCLDFNVLGGNKNHLLNSSENLDNLEISDYMKLSFSYKMSKGFFFRAESFFEFAQYIDYLAKDDRSIYFGYGGKSLQKRSHGESFIELFGKFKDGIFILDEPEAALSPERQLTLMAMIEEKIKKYNCQFIIATHSPILITLPNAEIFEIDENGKICKKEYEQTKQFDWYKRFISDPQKYLRYLLEDN
ncbi:MAG: AAA family ATPase [Christensenellales bacterium]